ncbi:zinc finger BED domain-containing protein 4-like [Armigeres subalbatus]|uniref:zinc finger BED domain-containing protein 4-like n=1 Tax=Armigeres subalbatus TaxID=124917 RepID=UPI002ED37526
MAENKRSVVWEFFVEIDDGHRARCVECNATISRGGTGKAATNSAMINHLKKHSDAFRIYREKEEKRKVNKTVTDLSQPTIQQSFSGNINWDDNSVEAKEITKLIAEMIVLDHQPLSMVQDQGFLRLMVKLQPKYKVPSMKHFKSVVLPTMYEKCKKAITQKKIKFDDLQLEIGYISFTTDICSSPNNKALISLTAH